MNDPTPRSKTDREPECATGALGPKREPPNCFFCPLSVYPAFRVQRPPKEIQNCKASHQQPISAELDALNCRAAHFRHNKIVNNPRPQRALGSKEKL